MKKVIIEYPETGERIFGEVCPRGTMARIVALETMLRKLEWSNGTFGACPVCENEYSAGHNYDCELAKLLGGEG